VTIVWAKAEAPRRFESRRPYLAIDPRAFFELFMVAESRPNEVRDGVAIVDICGPLEQRDTGWCDSYEAIKRRVGEAVASDAQSVLLRVDSPGGDVSGCFETAREVRAICDAAQKPLFAYVDGKACSAGYAFACAASAGVMASDTALVGSVGVISTRTDVTEMNATQGLRVALVTSGARKADGFPDSPITAEELAATQSIVDAMASVFFGLVADMRGLTAAAVSGMQATVYPGEQAVKARLADRVVNFDTALAIASGKEPLTMAAKSSYEEARAALEKAAEGDDHNAAAARRALAAMDEGNDGKAEGDDSDKGDSDKGDSDKGDDDKKAEGDDSDKKAESDDSDKKAAAPASDAAAASGMSSELNALAEVHKLRAEIAEKDAKEERGKLLASRPDFEPAMIKALQKAPLATVRELVKTLPKKPAAKPAATTAVQGTRGAGQGGSDPQPTSAVTEIDRAMGLTASSLGVAKRDQHSLTFGIVEKRIERNVAKASSNTPNNAGGAA
jgi:signal peptide peptidase SppA